MARKKSKKKRKSTKKSKKKSTQRSTREQQGGTAAVAASLVADAANDARPADDEPAVTDLDAEIHDVEAAAEPIAIDLDAELDDGRGVERLIAETLASAGVEEVATEEEPESPVDLGEEPPEEPVPESAIVEDAPREVPDLGPVSSPELRDRLLAAALAHAEYKDARYRVPFSGITSVTGWKLLVASLILLLAGAAAVLPPAWARPEPPASLDAAERAHSLRSALLLQAQQVEAFRVRSQRLPIAVEEIPVRLPGVRYVRSGTRAYQLVAYDVDGSAVIYDSADPAPAFRSIETDWALRAQP